MVRNIRAIILHKWEVLVTNFKEEPAVENLIALREHAYLLRDLNYTSNTYPTIKGDDWLLEFIKIVSAQDMKRERRIELEQFVKALNGEEKKWKEKNT